MQWWSNQKCRTKSTVDQARPWMIIACYASNIFCLVASMMVCVNGMSEILGPNWLRVSCPEKIGHRPWSCGAREPCGRSVAFSQRSFTNHSRISTDLNRLRRDYEEWFFWGHYSDSRIVPRLNCDYLTRHDNAGGRSHGQLHGGLWPGKQFLG